MVLGYKTKYGHETKVFIGPCLAKKIEGEEDDLLMRSLRLRSSFSDFKEHLDFDQVESMNLDATNKVNERIL